MSQISLKSISGITSITTPAGIDNQLTLHNNNTSEAVKLDTAGNLHFHNHLNITGVSTASNFKTGTSNLHNTGLNVQDLDVDGHTNLDNVSVAGVSTFTGLIDADGGIKVDDYIELFHYSGSNFIRPSNGALDIISGGSTNLAKFQPGGGVDLYFNGTKRFETENTGAIVSGILTVSQDLDVDGHTNLDNVSIAGITTGTIFKVPDATDAAGSTNHIAVGDNSDLKLYHDNNGDAYISNATGHLTIRNNTSGKIINLQPKSGANGVIVRYEGAVELYHDNVKRLYTDSDGVTIGQTAYAQLKIDGQVGDCILKSSGAELEFTRAASSNINCSHSSGSLNINTAGTTRMMITSVGEVRILPSTGGNTNTQFSFNNVASTPFISFKSNNVNEAAELRIEESGGGANVVFKNKNRNSLLHTSLHIDHSGALHTAKDGTIKSHPMFMGIYTQHDEHEGQLNYHSLMSPDAGIGGWVFLGHDYAANPYPVRTFKIAVPESGNSAIGTRVYQVWHNGDANYDYGGLYEIRINQWNNGSRFESVSIRCINGKRDDLYVVAYNNTNGIMIRTSTIWGSVWIRKAGWDENQLRRGSSYCAVENNGALAIYNAQGTDDGTVPTSGSPYNVYCFDASSHTGGRDIENNNNFAG